MRCLAGFDGVGDVDRPESSRRFFCLCVDLLSHVVEDGEVCVGEKDLKASFC